jgi:hypothetical protein
MGDPRVWDVPAQIAGTRLQSRNTLGIALVVGFSTGKLQEEQTSRRDRAKIRHQRSRVTQNLPRH